jgi:hypothetical protein
MRIGMAEQRSPMRDKETKPIRDTLKPRGLKLLEVRCYAVVPEHGGAELCRGTLDEVFLWIARQQREDWHQ